MISRLRRDFTEPEDDDSCSNDGSESDESDNAEDEE